ncbi:MAG TPA: neutral zinc metallopeptidase [Gemmatimonadales bacterium]|nr:neutral zinc metallopeptidase [Gemmatimonadales bacterium]
MRWTPGADRGNVEDRRGQCGGRGFGLPVGRLGIGGFLVLLVLSLIFKNNFFALLGGGGGAPVTSQAPVQASPEEEKMADFVTYTLNDVQDTWSKQFSSSGQSYQPAKLVLFRDSTETNCGYGAAAMGPFYCPGDQKAYIDLGFYEELKSRFGAPGDFAQAYVLAHEIGHHVQHQLGIDQSVRQAQESNPRQANELSVRMELQADCFAGVWGHSAAQRNLLDAGDVDEALNAATAIGDDRIQQQAGAGVNPETWTHGSSRQRVEWFRVGMESGDPEKCDTFEGALETKNGPRRPGARISAQAMRSISGPGSWRHRSAA